MSSLIVSEFASPVCCLGRGTLGEVNHILACEQALHLEESLEVTQEVARERRHVCEGRRKKGLRPTLLCSSLERLLAKNGELALDGLGL